MIIITKLGYVIFIEDLRIASMLTLSLIAETELHLTECVHGTPSKELSLSRDIKSNTP